MKRIIIIAVILVLSMVLAIPASASTTYETRHGYFEDETYNSSLDTYLRFYYDTSNPSQITSAFTYCSYNGDTSTPMTTDAVYLVDIATAVKSNRYRVIRYEASGTFLLSSTNHVDFDSMSSTPLSLSSYTINSLYGTTKMASYSILENHLYNHNEITQSGNFNTYPLSTETVYFNLTVYK